MNCIDAAILITHVFCKYIIRIKFNKNVKNFINIKEINIQHDGANGYWLEKQMGIKPNGENRPDLYGFEMKNDTKSKISFIDKTPSEKLYQGCKFETKEKEIKKKFWNTFKKKN